MEKSYSVYIHIPFCISKCRYCDFFSLPCKDKNCIVPDSYVEALCNEMNRLSGALVDTVYFGGGTPSLLKSYQIKKIFDALNKACRFTANPEISFEMNPDDVSEELLKALEECGVNRISCGIQSMTDEVLKRSGRRADASANMRALELFKQHWNKSLSLDFICALPLETEKSFIDSLESVLFVKPSHISMYSLTIEEKTPFGKELAEGSLNYDFDFADKLWLSARSFLIEKGFAQYEVSNFAKPGAECRHNLSYWNHKDYFGLGSGATETIYSENGEGIRWTNSTDVNAYTDFWKENNSFENSPGTKEIIDIETSEFEFFMMGLRTLKGINAAEFERIFNKKLPAEFLDTFNKWNEKGLCKLSENSDGIFYSLNSDGILYLNSFLEQLI